MHVLNSGDIRSIGTGDKLCIAKFDTKGENGKNFDRGRLIYFSFQ